MVKKRTSGMLKTIYIHSPRETKKNAHHQKAQQEHLHYNIYCTSDKQITYYISCLDCNSHFEMGKKGKKVVGMGLFEQIRKRK